ncbi:alpha/beta fold hydrolase [Teredinibacter sp. KSP-S5-2]|uniref:alpha/beta fold hydrolase n=1 Tax=Teredinibacter sp. KSP-S5-2 TaxID=3034506 RepID=UPI002934B471|nr:alpha/beta fold hydrolase [Teredinibacter sp. KSP-S5-2]WNO07973.1 alpha/beta hydrolase [Teredinibacter sp. KSP-S5-2]
MKLVFLPGMDGTGILFEALFKELQGFDVIALPLPGEGSQDYITLSCRIRSCLPNEDFVLVAESFSGGIAAQLSQQSIPYMKGVIFVASFLSSPNSLFAYLASLLPLGSLLDLPLGAAIGGSLLFNRTEESMDIVQLKRVLHGVPESILKSRLKMISRLEYDGFKSSIPTVYIGAKKDRLVPNKKTEDFKKAYRNSMFALIDGPHFILQAKPKECASAIEAAVEFLKVNKN